MEDAVKEMAVELAHDIREVSYAVDGLIKRTDHMETLQHLQRALNAMVAARQSAERAL